MDNNDNSTGTEELNKLSVFCSKCPSKIMIPGTGKYLQKTDTLPKMTVKKNAPEVETEEISEWFVVDDMFKFENIGFSHTVGNVKYLSCADCECGPLGWSDSDTKINYVAIPRIRQSESSL